MAFTVEDGTGLADANAYITVQEMKDYHADRGNTVTGGTGDLQKQIVQATDYIEQRFGNRFLGRKEFPDTQFLSFPRLDLVDRDGIDVLGIPQKLKNACAEYALQTANGKLFLTVVPDTTGLQLKRTKDVVGPIETEREYLEGGTVDNTVDYPDADRWLDEYLKPSGRNIRI